jgi:beta-N-acetylhexosaminidase
MSARERVGELFMAGLPSRGATATQISLLSGHDIDDVILANDTAHSQHTVERYTSKLTADLRVAGVAPFISTDQEGGEVQRLTGTGFSAMPTALRQGKLSTSTLHAASRKWGAQLLGAGVDLDLAPVADTVPAKHAKANQPIGRYDREFGHTPKVVAPHATAFVRGMNQAGVDTAVKHFPGLGRASGNTDTTPGVTDPTTRHDPYLKPYRAGISAGTQFVMVSSATYPHIDPHHLACFSTLIMTSMLRGDQGFHGVVISDDLGSSALAAYPVKTRAVDFFAAGGTMLLDTTPTQLPAMIRAIRAEQDASVSFASMTKAAVMKVLVAKARAGLVAAD